MKKAGSIINGINHVVLAVLKINMFIYLIDRGMNHIDIEERIYKFVQFSTFHVTLFQMSDFNLY